MHLTFWQPIPSFHQEGFLCALAEHPGITSVALRIEHPLPAEQVRLGWPSPQFRGVDVQPISPDSIPADGPDQVHLFTGFATHPGVWAAFDRLPHPSTARVYAYTEAPETRDWRAPLRHLKYRLAARRLAPHLHGVLAIGKLGETFYRQVTQDRIPVHPFAYYDCREADFPPSPGLPPLTSFTSFTDSPAPAVRFLYVGRLIPLKGVDRLLHALAPLRDRNWRLDLVGDGSERDRLQTLAARLGLATRLHWHGARPRSEIDAFYASADCLVQPSRKDGWGMTIPEALRHGCDVLATEACGAVDLVSPAHRLTGTPADWTEKLAAALATGPLTQARRLANQTRARTVSAEAGVARLMQILEASSPYSHACSQACRSTNALGTAA